MESSIQTVKDSLRKLSAALPDLPNKDARASSEAALENLRLTIDFGLDTEDKRDLANLTTAIFNQSTGLLHFLDTRSLDNGGDAPQKFVDKKERKKGFDILTNVLTKLSNEHMLDQEPLLVKQVLDVCLHTFRSEKAFEECIEPLVIVLQSCKPVDDNGDEVVDGKPTEDSKALNSADGRELFDSLAKTFYVGVQSIGVGIKRQKLRALGIISNRFPSIMDEDSAAVKGKKRFLVLLDIFDAQIKSSGEEKKEQQVLTGCLEGLSFAFDVEKFNKELRKKKATLKKIYNCICIALSGLARGEMSRYHLPLAAFDLFANHAELFKEFVVDVENLESSVDMCKMYLDSCRHHNKDVSTKALKAYEAWLGCARVGLVGQRDVLSRICRQFQPLLELDAKSRCLSLRGFGSFASAIKSIEGIDYLNNLWVQLASYMEGVLGRGDDTNREEVTMQLPSLIIAFADILMEMPQVNQEQIDLLVKLVEALFNSFPSMLKSRRFTCFQAWYFLLFTLDKKGAALHHFLERSVFRNLVKSIEPLEEDGVAGPGMPLEPHQRPQPCVDYSELWRSLHTENHIAWIARRGHVLSEDKTERIAMEVYDRLFVSVTKVVSRLDLTLESDDAAAEPEAEQDGQEGVGTDKMDVDSEAVSSRATPQASGMNGRERPRCFKDMELFLNLVEFCQLFMRGLKSQYFRNSYFMFCKCMVESSSRNPLLSGFFKLLTSAMKLLEDQLQGPAGSQAAVEMTGISAHSETLLCRNLISKFAQEVVARCEQFFQDLLAACLEFVLSLPPQIRSLSIQIPALKAALRMGISHPLMAEVAFECLDGLVEKEREELRPYLPAVLPLLDAYLIRHSEAEDNSTGPVLSAEQRNRRVATMLKKKSRTSTQQYAVIDKKQVAVKAVHLLGKLGPDNLWLCRTESKDEQSMTSFDTTKKIVKIRFGLQPKAEIFFDFALPRIIYLAENSTDRQSKVSACELLHALVICAIGEHTPTVGPGREEDRKRYVNLFQCLLPAAFRLAVDGEIVASKLFEPLSRQIVHWFSSNRHFQQEAEVVLNVVLDCVESQVDGKLRETAATWLSEYVKWALKGMTKEADQENAVIVKQLLRRLYGLMNHPSVCKRLGSYSAIQSLSGSLKPFSRLIDQFLLEIFHHMILSLRFVSADDPALNSERAAVQALDGLEKLLNRQKYVEMLNEKRQGNVRRIYETLEKFVDFLFSMIGSIEKPVRRYCRQLFVRLSAKTKGFSSPCQWIEKKSSKSGTAYFQNDSIRMPPENSKIGDFLVPFQHLLAAADVCEWLLENRFESPSRLLSDTNGITSAIREFLEHASHNLAAEGTVLASEAEKRCYIREKSQCIYAMLKLVATFACEYGEPKPLLQSLVSPLLLQVMTITLLSPGNIGLDAAADPVVQIEIPRQAERLFKVLQKFPDRIADCKATLNQVVSRHDALSLGSFKLESTSQGFYEVLRMFHGYRLLAAHGIGDGFEVHARSILKNLSEVRVRDLTHSKRAAAEAMLQFALEVLRSSGGPHSVWSEVFTDIQGVEWRDSAAWIFYEEFRQHLDDYLAYKFQSSPELRQIIFRKAMKTEMGSVILGNLLDSKVKSTMQNRDRGEGSEESASDLVKAYIENFDSIDRMIESEEGPHVFRKRQILDIVGRMVLLAPRLAFNMPGSEQRVCKAYVAILEYVNGGMDKPTLRSDDFQLFLHSLRMLPGIANEAPVDVSKSVLSETSRLLDKILPLSSSKLQKGDPKFTEFRMVFDALMDAIRRSRKGAVVMHLVRQHLFIDRDHIFMEEIIQALNDFVLSLDLDDARQTADEILLSVQKNSHGLDPASLLIQRTIINRFGVCVLVRLKTVNRQNATDLFSKQCQFLVDVLKDCSLESLADVSRVICVLQLLMTFYRVLDYNVEIKTVVHSAFRPAEADKKMHMTQIVLKYLTKIRKDPKMSEPPVLKKATADLKEEVARTLREFHQYVQNALLMVVLRTQEKITFVELAFKDCAWNQMVDTNVEIKMEVQPQFRRSIDALADFKVRMGVRAHARSLMPSSSQFSESYATLGNLTQEVSDLPSLFGAKEPSGDGASNVLQVSDDGLRDDLSLDPDEFNDNPTMRLFLHMLDRIYEKGFHQADASGGLPIWMKELQMSLEYIHPETLKPNEFNVRLFVAKMLINGTQRHADLFRAYANHFFRAFFDKQGGLAVLVAKKGETLGRIPGSFNSHLRDICILWGSWILPVDSGAPGFVLQRSSTPGLNIELGWNFIRTLMKLTPHMETAVAKSNVQFLAVFVEQWRATARADDLSACVKVIKDFLSLTVSKQEEENAEACKRVEICNSTGVQLLNVYVLQELQELERKEPTAGYNRISAGDLRSLFDVILNKFVTAGTSSNKENRKYRAKRLLKPAAQVCGYLLACSESLKSSLGVDSEYQVMCEALKERVRSLKAANQLDQAIFAASAAVSSNSSLAELFLPMAKENLIKLHGDFQYMVLNILMEYVFSLCKRCRKDAVKPESKKSVAVKMEDDADPADEGRHEVLRLWSDIGHVIPKMLEKQDEKLQLLTLRMFTGRDDEGKPRLPGDGRGGLFAFLNLDDICREIPAFVPMINATFPDHRSEACRQHYYRLLMDLCDFWTSDTPASAACPDELYSSLVPGLTDASERIQNLVLEWWHTKGLTEDPSPRLLALIKRKRSAQGAGYYWVGSSAWLLLASCKQALDEELFDRPLQDTAVFREVRISTKAAAQVGSMAPMFAGSLQMSSQYVPQSVRASQTQGTLGIDGVLDTQFMEDSTQSQGFGGAGYLDNQTQIAGSDLFVSRRREGAPNRSFDGVFKRPLPRARVTSTGSNGQKSFFARRNEELNAFKERSKIERANRVDLVRRYRQGEVPDIQIKREDVIKPLQRLVILDSEVARYVFVELVASMPSDGEASDTDRKGPRKPAKISGMHQGVDLSVPIQQEIALVLRLPETDSADVVDALLGVASAFHLRLPASAIVSAGDRSMNFFKSIQALECQALSTEPPPVHHKHGGGRGTKRAIGQSADRKGKQDYDQFADEDWFQLSKLYHHLEENDIVRGLYERFSKHKETREGLNFELKGDFAKAMECYNGLRKRSDEDEWSEADAPSVLEVDLWDKGIKDCLRGLQMWDELQAWIRDELELSGSLCDSSCKEIWEPEQRKELDLYVRCLIGKGAKEAFEKVGAEDTAAGLELAQVVFDAYFDESGRQQRKKLVLETELIPETALAITLKSADLKNNRLQISKTGLELVGKGYDKFLRMWSSSGSIGAVTKRNLLRTVQMLVELQEYFQFAANRSLDSGKSMLQNWSSRLPRNELDDNDSWLRILSCRLALMQKLRADDVLRRDKSLVAEIDKSVVTTQLTLSSLARRRGNLQVASYWLDRAVVYKNGDAMKTKLSKSALKLNRCLVKEGAKELSELLPPLLADPQPSAANEIEGAKLLALQADVLAMSPDEKHKAKAYKKYQAAVNGMQSLIQGSSAAPPSDSSNRKISSVFLKCANFCNEQLDQPSCKVQEEYADAFVDNLLSAMRLGCQEAAAHFPRLLEVLTKFPSTQKTFVRCSTTIPMLSVLHWLPQIFSEVCRGRQAAPATSGRKKSGSSTSTGAEPLVPLLQRMAQDFPQAVYFAYRILREDLDGQQKGTPFLETLDIPLRKREALEEFCVALQQLQEPHQQLEDFLRKPDEAVYKEVYQDCLDPSNPVLGQYRQQFAKNLCKEGLVDILGQRGVFNRKCDIARAKGIVEKDKKKNEKDGPQQLIHLNKTLAEYDGHSTLHSDGVVVPGQRFQHSGITTEHEAVRIASFDPTLVVMKSLRKPKRLIVRGSDGKDSWWLVKGGEDLRQDERVQQVFEAMNLVLATDPRCAQLRLSLATYKVIPVSMRAGIIEWVRNTQVLGDVIESTAGKDVIDPVRRAYRVLYPEQKDYKTALENAKNEGKLAARMSDFEDVVRLIPAQTLREGMLRFARTAKAEFEMRMCFAQSLASISVCHYLVGIGDRHTSNILIFQQTGGLLGIDFGHAFGSATQLLPIPELMPFRLTAQLLGVLQPLDSAGLLKRSMTYVMSALRTNKDLLRQTMKIFITDPTVDWADHAKKQCKDAKVDSIAWLTGIKEKALDDKFAGVHPAVVMLDELKSSQIDWIKQAAADRGSGIHRILAGPGGQRLRDPQARLSAKEQVDALVEQATDPAVLGHTWNGWAPYF